MKKVLFVLIIAACAYVPVFSQNEWTLRQTVEYAIAHNITVRQANISSLRATLDARQASTRIYPSASFNNNTGFRFGRVENPVTGVFENTNSVFSTFGFNTSVNIFNFYSQRNNISGNRFLLESAKASEEKAKNDIALRVANAYLLALQAKEQVIINDYKIKLSQEQLLVTRKRVDAGALPELNAAEIEAQLATDSSTLVTSISERELRLLELKAILNLDAAVPFDIETPDESKIRIQSLADLQPEHVFQLALANLPQRRINEFNLNAAQKFRDAARGNMFPSISIGGQLSTNFFQPFQSPRKIPFGHQIETNFGQSIGLGLNVPLFNGYFARTNWEKAKLDIRDIQLQSELDIQTLKQDIYTAYNSALAALQKNIASQKAVETAQRSYDLSKKRYDANLLTSFELITNQNNLFKAQIDLLLARYDYIFKMKLLEFYKGEGMQL